MDARVRTTLVEMNRRRERKKKFKTEALQRSQAKLTRVSQSLKSKLKVKRYLNKAKKYIPKVDVTPSCVRGFFHEVFPFVDIMRSYSLRKYLLKDFVAGMTIGIIHIPQGKYIVYVLSEICSFKIQINVHVYIGCNVSMSRLSYFRRS